MVIGVPKEIKPDEYRIGIVPAGVELLTQKGHDVIIEEDGGLGSGITNGDYEAAGATMLPRKGVFEKADMIYKVKEPLPEEYELLKEGQIVFTYFHFAASEELTRGMMDRKVIAVAYETIQEPDGSLPLLTAMSEVAGRMAVQEGAKYLERPMEGRGILLAGIPGVPPADVVIIGGGIVGSNAAKIAAGLGARVSILDINLERLRYLDDVMPPNVVTLMSDAHTIREKLQEADLVVGAVLIPGAIAPRLVTKEMLKLMKPRAVIVDVAIDQGGCFETSKPTTHSKPIYIVDDVVHYCVANMPGAVGRTSTYGLTNSTLAYAVQLADKGYKKALKENAALAKGLNIIHGKVTYQAVAEAFNLEYTPAEKALK